ncbi:unnamed protein product, partial [Prorocentrum cordatum]
SDGEKQGYDGHCAEVDYREANLGDGAGDDDERGVAEYALAAIASAEKDVQTQERTLAQARAVVEDMKQSLGFCQKSKARGRGKSRLMDDNCSWLCFIRGVSRKQLTCPGDEGNDRSGASTGKVQQVDAVALSCGISGGIPNYEIELGEGVEA